MTVKECYELMEADYSEVIHRLGTPERIAKFLVRFPEDQSYAELREAYASGDAETAFRAAHTLKGVCMNLSLTRLFRSADALTEALRGKELTEDISRLLKQLQDDYEHTLECINKFAQPKP